MKHIFLSISAVFLMLFGNSSILFSMESKTQNKDILTNIPALLGYSGQEVKINKSKQSEYLGKVQLLASLSLVQETLRRDVSIMSDTTDAMQNYLKDSYYRIGFKYIDRPCKVSQILEGSLVTYEDNDGETEIIPSQFICTTPEAKAAYL